MVDADQKGGEGFSGAGGGGDESGVAGEDAGPAVGLGLGGAAEFVEEPLGRDRVRPGKGFGNLQRHSLIVARFLFVVCSPVCYLHVALADIRGSGGFVGFVEILFDHFFEGALGGEDEVDGVSAAAEAAGVGGNVVGD